MATTTLKPYGGPGPAYGTIAGKAPAADGPHNPGAITTLWAWGAPGGRRTFAAKDAADADTSGTRHMRQMRAATRRRRKC